MKDSIRKFLYSERGKQRIIAFLLVTLLGILCGHYIACEIGIPGWLITVFLLIPVEIVLDYFALSGTGDVLLTLTVVFVGNMLSIAGQYSEAEMNGEAVFLLAVMVVSAYDVIMLADCIGRRFSFLVLQCVLALVGVVLEGVFIVLLADYLYVTFVILVLMAIMLSVLRNRKHSLEQKSCG